MNINIEYDREKDTMSIKSDDAKTQKMLDECGELSIRACPGCILIQRKEQSRQTMMDSVRMFIDVGGELLKKCDILPEQWRPTDWDENNSVEGQTYDPTECVLITPEMLDEAGFQKEEVVGIRVEDGYIVLEHLDDDDPDDECVESVIPKEKPDLEALAFQMIELMEDYGLDFWSLYGKMKEEAMDE